MSSQPEPESAVVAQSQVAYLGAFLAASQIAPANARLEGEHLFVAGQSGAALAALLDAFDWIAAARSAKLAELAALRFNKETAGVNGIRTDRESQALLTGAALAASLDPDYEVDWKGEAGWTTLNAVQLLGAAQAVRGHVQACFSNEREHATAIALLDTVEAIEAYDLSSGWPA